MTTLSWTSVVLGDSRSIGNAAGVDWGFGVDVGAEEKSAVFAACGNLDGGVADLDPDDDGVVAEVLDLVRMPGTPRLEPVDGGQFVTE